MKTKIYKVSTDFSIREIIARNKQEAIEIFKRQIKGLISENDTIKIV